MSPQSSLWGNNVLYLGCSRMDPGMGQCWCVGEKRQNSFQALEQLILMSEILTDLLISNPCSKRFLFLSQNCKWAAPPEPGLSHCPLPPGARAVSQGCGAQAGSESLFKQKSQGWILCSVFQGHQEYLKRVSGPLPPESPPPQCILMQSWSLKAIQSFFLRFSDKLVSPVSEQSAASPLLSI